ncbi:MAG: Na+/H+ antiporter NhaC family protein [Bacillota bacterium]
MKYLMPIISLLLIIIFIIINKSLAYAFMISSLLSILYFSVIKKYNFKLIINYYIQGIINNKIIFPIILSIGAIVSVWLGSGIVPTLIYYGFDFVKLKFIYVIAFVFSSIVSIFMGTALGTISTVGLAIIGIGLGFGVDFHILLGAIISGSFIADKISPISGLFNLLLVSSKTKYKNVLSQMKKTLIPVYLITFMFFLILDLTKNVKVENIEKILEYKNLIIGNFTISPYFLVIPLLVIILPFFKLETIKSLLIGIFSGSILMFFYQNLSILKILRIIFLGYNSKTNTILDTILKSGGVISMVEVIIIVAGALGLINLFEEIGLLDNFNKIALKNIEDKYTLKNRTSIISMFLTIVSCDQTLGIILPIKIFKEKFSEFNLKKEELARIISDTGVVIAPLMPWNVNIIIISSIFGLTDYRFIFYIALCYLFPLLNLLINTTKKMSLKKDI